jgi:hypothetical protein
MTISPIYKNLKREREREREGEMKNGKKTRDNQMIEQ